MCHTNTRTGIGWKIENFDGGAYGGRWPVEAAACVNAVSMHEARDLVGNQVPATIGGNLTVQSVQDTTP